PTGPAVFATTWPQLKVNDAVTARSDTVFDIAFMAISPLPRTSLNLPPRPRAPRPPIGGPPSHVMGMHFRRSRSTTALLGEGWRSSLPVAQARRCADFSGSG